jgi:hypothetical protein
MSGIQSGRVVGIVPSMEVVSGSGNLRLTNLIEVAMPAASGEAGAPLFDETTGALAAVLVGGNSQRTVAIEVSRLPRLPEPRRSRTRVKVPVGSGNGAGGSS